MTTCPNCMRYENLLDKQRKEIASLKAKLKDSPLQAISNLRAEVLERTKPICNPPQSQSGISNLLPTPYYVSVYK